MLHDNACPHTAAATQDLIATFGLEQFDHPPYSLDLTPRDFHVFLHLKTVLGGRWFHDDNEVKEAINTWFASQATSFYKNCCPAMSSASTMVETMSKSSARYVHQMAI
jgi:histone-lysine N-methyltransferase SETMAR